MTEGKEMESALQSAKWWLQNACDDHKHSEMYKFATALVAADTELTALRAENARLVSEMEKAVGQRYTDCVITLRNALAAARASKGV